MGPWHIVRALPRPIAVLNCFQVSRSRVGISQVCVNYRNLRFYEFGIFTLLFYLYQRTSYY